MLSGHLLKLKRAIFQEGGEEIISNEKNVFNHSK